MRGVVPVPEVEVVKVAPRRPHDDDSAPPVLVHSAILRVPGTMAVRAALPNITVEPIYDSSVRARTAAPTIPASFPSVAATTGTAGRHCTPMTWSSIDARA